ncbi:TRAP transporter small permease subunit [Thermodesulfobacteriota bacterium]
MERFANIIRWLSRAGMALGAVFLVAMMVLVVMNVGVRPFGRVIGGTIEVVELMAVVIVAFALAYTALSGSHVIVDIVVSRLSQRTQQIFKSFTYFLYLVTLVLITWANAGLTYRRYLVGEETDLHRISYIPFRSIWVLGLIIFCLVISIELFRALREVLKK